MFPWSWKKKNAIDFNVTDPHPEEGHCFISGKVSVTGEVHFAGTLRIDGKIDGKVAVYDGKKGTLIVSKGAMVNGPVVATDLITDGTINGEVTVENRLECRANSTLKGEVRYKTISIADGARIDGRCQQYHASGKVEELMTTKEKPVTHGPVLATRQISLKN